MERTRETYLEMKERHQAEVNALPIGFAFSEEQYTRQLETWGITKEEADAGAIVGIGGGFIRSSDRDLVLGTLQRIHEESNAAILSDPDGSGYIYEMFFYELANHEFAYTRDISETLEDLGISNKDLAENKALLDGLNLAVKALTTQE